MNKLKLLFSALLLFVGIIVIHAQTRTVALVVDQMTYDKARTEIHLYADAIRSDGLVVQILARNWERPCEIREELKRLYQDRTAPLEGAVLIGCIPIPMIRNAQHLTTAFKMGQERPWHLSSVPSDRFYDDFNLKFDYIKQDSINPLLHYYSLRWDSPQRISTNIYSARIKAPTTDEDRNKHEHIRFFLRKAVDTRNNKRQMEYVFVYVGNGYNSDCMIARFDEKIALREQFPFLANTRNNLTYLKFNFENVVKSHFVAGIQNPRYDIAIIHHHGYAEEQIISNISLPATVDLQIEHIKRTLRSRVRRDHRRGGDTTTIKQNLINQFGVPASWVEGAFDPEIMRSDSVLDALRFVNIDDLRNMSTMPRFVMFDACFNGSFHLDDYVAARYIFGEGKTVVTLGNSVNSLQDRWANDLLGLFNLGVSAGNIFRNVMTLELHLMGDPTFRFVSADQRYVNLNADIVLRANDMAFWRTLLNSSKHADAQGLAMKMLHKNNAISSDELMTILETSPLGVVRMQALFLLIQNVDDNFIPALKLSLNDDYELVRRIATLHAVMSGSPELVQPLVCIAVESGGQGRRVRWQSNRFINLYHDKDVLLEALNNCNHQWDPSILPSWEQALTRREAAIRNDHANLFCNEGNERTKIFYLRSLRNNPDPRSIPVLFRFIDEQKDINPRLAIIAAEALGWYNFSYRRPEIIAQAEEMLPTIQNQEVFNELQKTINRLTAR